MLPKHWKRGVDPTPHERHIRDPETNEVKAVSRSIARSRTMPPESKKPKAVSKFFEGVEIAQDPKKGKPVLVRPNPPSTSNFPSLTKHKDAPQTPEEFAQYPKPWRAVPLRPQSPSTTIPPSPMTHRDVRRIPKEVAQYFTPNKPVLLRPNTCGTTMSPESKEKGDPLEKFRPAPDYITMQSKGYDKGKGRATHRGYRADISTEGSDTDESADDAGAVGGETAGTEAAGTAEAMLKRVLMMQVQLEERLLAMEARLQQRLPVIEALLGQGLQERWRLRRGSLRESYSDEDEEGDEETLMDDSETDI